MYRHSFSRDTLTRQKGIVEEMLLVGRALNTLRGHQTLLSFLVSWKTRAGVTLAAAGRSEVDPARVAALLHILEGSEKAGRRHVLGIQK